MAHSARPYIGPDHGQLTMLDDKVVVITGASGRLGSRIVQRFVDDGVMVAAVYRSEEEAAAFNTTHPGKSEAFAIDLAKEAHVRSGFDQILERFYRIDAVIHAVGTWEAHPLAKTTLEDWRRVMDVNLTSTFLCFREALRVMEGPGRLIAFASRQGADRAVAEQAAYAAAKAGLIRLVEAISAEYADRGITAHAVAPSTILFANRSGGVYADDLINLCRMLVGTIGRAVSGATIRAYGDG